MKFLSFLSVIALCAITLFTSCGSDGDAARDAAVENTGLQAADGTVAPAPTPNVTPNTPPATPEPPQNAEGVWHYTCPKGCAGGGGSATACPSCGETLAHNTTYHANQPTTTPPATTITPAGDNALTPVPPPAQAKPAEPAQNAAGVWHYTCSAGCAGGAGSAVACSSCGATLAHNTTYHQ